MDVQQEVSIPSPVRFHGEARGARGVEGREPRHTPGVLITLEDTAQDGGTDSYRLAITEAELPESSAEEFQAVIAGSFLQEISSLPRSEDDLKLALAENQIVVTYHDTVFINRRLEGNFPNYRQLLPDSYATRVSMDVGHLVAGVKRTSLLGQTSSPVRFDINMASQTVQLSAVAQDVGSAQETLSCEGEGEDVEIAFNYAYVLDGLSSVSTDNVFLEVQSSMKPGIFKADEGENFLYLVMPVRIA
ncbi:MAG: DNA polymerase III subunit beta [Eggerthella lenta]